MKWNKVLDKVELRSPADTFSDGFKLQHVRDGMGRYRTRRTLKLARLWRV